MNPLGNRSLDWIDDAVTMVDQTRLPQTYTTLRIETSEQMVHAIERLSVRGAPALGVAGAFGVVLAMHQYGSSDRNERDQAIDRLRHARPTAINLSRMVDRVATLVDQGKEAVLAEALAIRDEEIDASVAMGERGADWISTRFPEQTSFRIMTICNTGGLATVERGTALAVIQTLHERSQLTEALVVETRPLLQGARLTCWELERMGAPYRLLVDSAAAFSLATMDIDAVLVGADRITANGDTANKIGTFSLALGAQYSSTPLMVVAPESTIDMDTPSGAEIIIEQRNRAEVTTWSGVPTAPPETQTLNPAFDVTPVALIDSLVTDRRVIHFSTGVQL